MKNAQIVEVKNCFSWLYVMLIAIFLTGMMMAEMMKHFVKIAGIGCH